MVLIFKSSNCLVLTGPTPLNWRINSVDRTAIFLWFSFCCSSGVSMGCGGGGLYAVVWGGVGVSAKFSKAGDKPSVEMGFEDMGVTGGGKGTPDGMLVGPGVGVLGKGADAAEEAAGGTVFVEVGGTCVAVGVGTSG